MIILYFALFSFKLFTYLISCSINTTHRFFSICIDTVTKSYAKEFTLYSDLQAINYINYQKRVGHRHQVARVYLGVYFCAKTLFWGK